MPDVELPNEIFAYIFTWCSAFTLSNAAAVSHLFRATVHNVLRLRFQHALSPWIQNISLFEPRLMDYDAVIGGSVAVAFLQVEGCRTIMPRTLDVFCPSQSFDAMIHDFVSTEGYTRLLKEGEDGWAFESDRVDDPDEEEVSMRGVSRWVRLRREAHIVNVVCSETSSAFLPLSLAWSTLLMTAITPVSLHCPYPSLARERLFLHDSPRDSDDDPFTTMILAHKVSYYEAQGFREVLSRKSLKFGDQRRTAVKRMRSFDDDEALVLRFGATDFSAYADRSFAQEQVIWRMGCVPRAGFEGTEVCWWSKGAGSSMIWSKTM